MAVILATDENFDQLISEGMSIVDFFSTYCGPCRALLPTLREIEANMPFLNLIKVNTDNCPSLARRYKIFSLPTLYLSKDGNMQEYRWLLERDPLMKTIAQRLYE